MILVGAGGHGKVVADIVLSSMPNVQIHAFFDDALSNVGKILGIPVLNMERFLEHQAWQCIVCIGNNQIRKKITESINIEYVTAIHKNAVISSFSKIYEGSVIMANAVVNADAIIGTHCIINTSAVVEHDCRISDFVHISPGAALAGNVMIGEGSHIGIGASIIPGVKIGRWAIIGAGTVVIRDVPDYAVVVGNPARIIRFQNHISVNSINTHLHDNI